MDELRLAQLLSVQRCYQDGDLLPVLKKYSASEFNRANLRCAEAMRSGQLEEAREFAYTAKAIEAYPDDFMRFIEKELARAQS